jgi:ABC-type multidrug transport system ATPase subunit
VLGMKFDVGTDGLSGLTETIQSDSVYIPQREFFYPTQTSEEAVAFTVNIKFGRGDDIERKQLFHSCLDIVGLPAELYASRKIGGDLPGKCIWHPEKFDMMLSYTSQQYI